LILAVKSRSENRSGLYRTATSSNTVIPKSE
jgi:hypothetical protein